MAILWIEGFDHYGTGSNGRLEMLDGVYAGIAALTVPTTAQSRTGGTSLVFAGYNDSCRRIFGAAKTTVGVGFAYYPTALPANPNNSFLVSLANSQNEPQVTLLVNTTGSISICIGGDYELITPTHTVVATTADGIVTAASWNHIELKATSSATGAAELRVNGVTVASFSGSTLGLTPNEFSQMNWARTLTSTAGTADFYIDDAFAWDDSGDYNNDFVGDVRVLTKMPDDDTAQAEFTPVGSATGYGAIDEIPSDEDTTYIENMAFTGLDVSDFEIADITETVGAIRAVQTYVKQRKTVAGTCTMQASLVSGSDISLGTDRPITEIYTYYTDVHEEDPATGAPWTEAGFDAALLRIERTS